LTTPSTPIQPRQVPEVPGTSIVAASQVNTVTVTVTGNVTGNVIPPSAQQPVRERIYVGVDIGYRHHVACAIPFSMFNVHKYGKDQWKRAKVIKFPTDANGFNDFLQHLSGFSQNPQDFLVLMEPTGGYYAMAVMMFLLNQGYAVMQVENITVKDYREKIFGSQAKTDVIDARVMARMGFLNEFIGEEFSIQPVRMENPDESALRVTCSDLVKLEKEITRRKNQLQQVLALTFPELKSFFTSGTASPTARLLLNKYPTPRLLSQATPKEVTELLSSAKAYRHAKRAAELIALAERSVGVPSMALNQWRQSWILRQLNVLVEARDELMQQIEQAISLHPYTPIIESLPVKSPIWTAKLIAVIGNVDRFTNYAEFRSYMGWSPKQSQSGTSVHSSSLANEGVRMSRNVLGQMSVVLLAPNVRTNPFREYYQRMVVRGVPGGKALGHLAGKLSTVLCQMLKTNTPYDENKHRKALKLPVASVQTTLSSIDVTDEIEEITSEIDSQEDLPLEGITDA
jgi:transposase